MFADRGALLRAAAVLLAAVFAFVIVLRVSAAGVYGDGAPIKALRWAPNHAAGSAGAAARLLAADRPEEARRLAAAALARNPTNVAALRTLGLAAEAAGDQSRAGRLFALAFQLSRRDRPTQVWLIGQAIGQADYESAVRYFDIGMRTSSRGLDQLIPLLVAATADARALPALARLLDRNPDWKLSFLEYLATTGPRPERIVALSRGRLDPSLDEERAMIRHLITRLLARNEHDLAWQVYREARGQSAGAAGARDGGFEGGGDLTPFEWALAGDADLSASREPRGGGHVLALAARSGRGGEVARQLIRLAPGRYRLDYLAGAIPAEARERPAIVATCVTGGEPLVMARAEQSGAGPSRVAAAFEVGAACPWLWLSVQAGAAETTPSQDPWIDNVAIRPA